MIIYSDSIEKANGLPYHLTTNDESIVFEEDIITCICQNNRALYERYFLSSPNFHLYALEENNQVAYPLIAFLNECVNIFDAYVEADVKGSREREEGLTYVTSQIQDVVIAIAKVGFKVQMGDIKEGETPSEIFERALRKGMEE